jgi:hypothetical protein
MSTAVTDSQRRPVAAPVRALAATSEAVLRVVLGIVLGMPCWMRMEPIGIAEAGFDAREHAGRATRTA